jgi:hypothetical protein
MGTLFWVVTYGLIKEGGFCDEFLLSRLGD